MKYKLAKKNNLFVFSIEAVYDDGVSNSVISKVEAMNQNDITYVDGSSARDSTIYSILICSAIDNLSCEENLSDSGEQIFTKIPYSNNDIYRFSVELITKAFPTDPRNNPSKIDIQMNFEVTYDVKTSIEIMDDSDDNIVEETRTGIRNWMNFF